MSNKVLVDPFDENYAAVGDKIGFAVRIAPAGTPIPATGDTPGWPIIGYSTGMTIGPMEDE